MARRETSESKRYASFFVFFYDDDDDDGDGDGCERREE